MTLIESLQTLANYSRPEIEYHAAHGDMKETRKAGRDILTAVETLATNLGISMNDIDVAEIRRQYEWALEVRNEK